MNDIFDILSQETTEQQPKQSKREFTPEEKAEYADRKQAEREKLSKMSDKVVDGIKNDPQILQQYLGVLSQFRNHSVNNTLLIMAQYPKAKVVGDYKYWNDNGHRVKKGTKEIKIFEPAGEYRKEDGSVGYKYNVKRVFDISDTNAYYKAPPMYDGRAIVTALKLRCPADIGPANDPNAFREDIAASFDPMENKIDFVVRESTTQNDILQALMSEVSHAVMAQGNPNYDKQENGCRAYCAGYMLCKQYGINTDNYDLSLPQKHFENFDTSKVKEELKVVRDTSKEVSDLMYKYLKDYDKGKPRDTDAR